MLWIQIICGRQAGFRLELLDTNLCRRAFYSLHEHHTHWHVPVGKFIIPDFQVDLMLVYEIKAVGVALVPSGSKIRYLRILKSLDHIGNLENIYSSPTTIKVRCNAAASDIKIQQRNLWSCQGQCQVVHSERPRFCCVMPAVALLQDFYTASPQLSQVVPTGGFQARLVRISPLGFDGSRAAMQLELYGLLIGSV